MRYILFLTLFITLCSSIGDARAQEKFYRVEILVLSHLQHDSEPLKVKRPRDYSGALDFLIIPEVDEEDGDTAAEAKEPEQVAVEESTGDALPDPGEVPVEEEIDPWAGVLHIETRSDVMADAWRRLRLSAPFRPQQYLSWVQSADEPFPLLRIHNQEVVLIEDPYAEQRLELEQLAAEAALEENTPVFTDQPENVPDQVEAEPGLPDPTLFYHVDGTVKLIRTRFLHVELDLEMREPLFEVPETVGTAPVTYNLLEDEDTGEPQPTSFNVHKLQQSRQVKKERMEYFDGPVLGVLAYVTDFDMESFDEQQESADE